MATRVEAVGRLEQSWPRALRLLRPARMTGRSFGGRRCWQDGWADGCAAGCAARQARRNRRGARGERRRVGRNEWDLDRAHSDGARLVALVSEREPLSDTHENEGNQRRTLSAACSQAPWFQAIWASAFDSYTVPCTGQPCHIACRRRDSKAGLSARDGARFESPPRYVVQRGGELGPEPRREVTRPMIEAHGGEDVVTTS